MGPVTVMLAGNESQQQEHIPPFCDPRNGYQQRGSLAYAERTGGFTIADVGSTAHKDGDGYILNGTKRDVIHGWESATRVVLLRLENTVGIEGLCAIHDSGKTGWIADQRRCAEIRSDCSARSFI